MQKSKCRSYICTLPFLQRPAQLRPSSERSEIAVYFFSTASYLLPVLHHVHTRIFVTPVMHKLSMCFLFLYAATSIIRVVHTCTFSPLRRPAVLHLSSMCFGIASLIVGAFFRQHRYHYLSHTCITHALVFLCFASCTFFSQFRLALAFC